MTIEDLWKRYESLRPFTSELERLLHRTAFLAGATGVVMTLLPDATVSMSAFVKLRDESAQLQGQIIGSLMGLHAGTRPDAPDASA